MLATSIAVAAIVASTVGSVESASSPSSYNTAPPYNFGGEEYLQYELPNYPVEEDSFTLRISLTIAICALLPTLYLKFILIPHHPPPPPEQQDQQQDQQRQSDSKKVPSPPPPPTQPKILKYRIVNGKRILITQASSSSSSSNHASGGSADIPLTSGWLLLISTLLSVIVGVICCTYYVWTHSPHNVQVARGIFEAPLLTTDEVQEWLNIGSQVATRNVQLALEAKKERSSNQSISPKYEEFLTTPMGWRKFRQPAYPLTDLQVESDPFTNDELDWIQDKLDKRLAPLLQRIYGVPPSSLLAPGQLLVRYEQGVHTNIKRHTDDQHLSYNILLSKNFTGGGTKFWNRMTNTSIVHVNPTRIGQVLINTGLIDHEGVPVETGTRFIVVGFISVDRKDRLNQPTGLSLYASWLSINWLARNLILTLEDILEYVQRDIIIEDNGGGGSSSNKPKRYERLPASQFGVASYIPWLTSDWGQEMIISAVNFFTYMGDQQAPHYHAKLVQDDDADAYIHALDEAFEKTKNKSDDRSTTTTTNLYDDRKGLANWFGFRYLR